jgi:hypothetical protein
MKKKNFLILLFLAMISWWRERYLYRDWRPVLVAILFRLCALVGAHTVYSIGVFFLTRSEPLTRRAFVFFLVWLVLRMAFLFALPYWLALQYRRSATRARLSAEGRATRKERNAIAREYAAVENPPITIFFPDAYDDDLSVCAYTGYEGAFPGQRGVARHLDAASIIARPHVSLFTNRLEMSTLFVMPELRVRPAGYGAPFLDRVRYWVARQLDYIVGAQMRESLHRFYVPSGRPCAYAQKPDIARGLEIVNGVINSPRQLPGFVLFGCGRGANLALEVYAHLPVQQRNLIKGLVLEAPITDSVLLSQFTHAYREQNPHEIPRTPLQTVRTFPPSAKDVHFLIVVSRADELADTNSLVELKHELEQRSEKGCNFVRLNEAPHGAYATHNGNDALTYEEAALTFYSTLIEGKSQ